MKIIAQPVRFKTFFFLELVCRVRQLVSVRFNAMKGGREDKDFIEVKVDIESGEN